MKRREFLTGAVTGAVVAATTTYAATSNQTPPPMAPGTPSAPGRAPAINGGLHEWKMVTTWPKNFPGAGTAAQELADNISHMSSGRLTVKLFAAGEVVPAFESFDAVREGTAECAHSAPYYWVAKKQEHPVLLRGPRWLERDRAQRLDPPRRRPGTVGRVVRRVRCARIYVRQYRHSDGWLVSARDQHA